MIEQGAAPNRLYRSRRERMVAGVAGGLGQYLNVDSVLIRLAFVLLALTNGVGVLAYIVMMIVVPERPVGAEEPVVNGSVDRNRSREIVGFVLIAAGALLLTGTYHIVDWGRLWPLVIIGAGIFLLLRRRVI